MARAYSANTDTVGWGYLVRPHILFLFLDGIGLGEDDPDTNPFAAATLPTLNALTNGRKWLRKTGIQTTSRATFVPTDPQLNMPGRPQSGTSQAAILTGQNIPQIIGRHYGPKPDAETRDILTEDNFFKQVVARGGTAGLIEAYPPGFHNSIKRGKTLPSSYQLAAISAGQTLFDIDALVEGRALAADWTGEGLRNYMKQLDIPVYEPRIAGHKLVEISRSYTFAMHANWISDTLGHRGPFEDAVALLETFDGVLQGVMEAWEDEEGLVIITSDHGNMEDISSRHHTENQVPTLIIGAENKHFAQQIERLTDFVPAMKQFLFTRN